MTRFESAFNLPTLHKASVGFDRMFEELGRQFENSATNGYPPYNIIQLGDDEYEISMAVAGFSQDQLSIVHERNVLRIEGDRGQSEDSRVYLHKGIAGRNFKREFTLADHLEVASAKLEFGMLVIRLVRNVPEELQPKKIEISEF